MCSKETPETIIEPCSGKEVLMYLCNAKYQASHPILSFMDS